MTVFNEDNPQKRAGFSLVEVIISLVLLTLVALSFSKLLVDAQFTAEDNLYDATALTIAVSTIEQMKGATLGAITDPPEVGGKEVFELIVGGGAVQQLVLDEPNTLEVPIVTAEDGSTTKNLALIIVPSIDPSTSTPGYWLEIEYSYAHPRTGRVRSNIVRNMRSTVPVF